MAVRLAVAEVQVVTENKDFLAQHGVDIDALESTHSANRAVARSTTTLLVKNLPATTVPDEIESMFARYGSIAGEYLFFLLYLFCFCRVCTGPLLVTIFGTVVAHLQLQLQHQPLP